MGLSRSGLVALISLCSAAYADPARQDGGAAPTSTGRLMSPQAHAAEVATHLPFVVHALHELRIAAAAIKEPPLRAAVEAQLQAPWLPPEAYVFAHPAETEKKLHDAGLLAADAHLVAPALGAGSISSAPGGTCVTGHHGYPGGLAVHEWANLSHARALAKVYKDIYGVDANDDWLVAAALWHDIMKAGTLPWTAEGDCPHAEPQLAGTALHHPLGLAAAILRHLPPALILVIASAHAPPTEQNSAAICGWLRAASIIATGDEKHASCPAFDANAKRPPLEAFLNNSGDIDYPLTGGSWSWYASQTPGGWERFAALQADGSDLAAFQRAAMSNHDQP
jgi:hypothetical protein